MLKLILLAAVAACIAAQTFQDSQNQLNQQQNYATAPVVGQTTVNQPPPGYPYLPTGYPYLPPGYPYLPPGYPYPPPGFPFQLPGLGSGSHGGKSKKKKHGGKSRKGSGGKSGKKGKKGKKGKGKKSSEEMVVDPVVQDQDPFIDGSVPQVVP